MAEQPSVYLSENDQTTTPSQPPHHVPNGSRQMMLPDSTPSSINATSSHVSTPPEPCIASIVAQKRKPAFAASNEEPQTPPAPVHCRALEAPSSSGRTHRRILADDNTLCAPPEPTAGSIATRKRRAANNLCNQDLDPAAIGQQCDTVDGPSSSRRTGRRIVPAQTNPVLQCSSQSKSSSGICTAHAQRFRRHTFRRFEGSFHHYCSLGLFCVNPFEYMIHNVFLTFCRPCQVPSSAYQRLKVNIGTTSWHYDQQMLYHMCTVLHAPLTGIPNIQQLNECLLLQH